MNYEPFSREGEAVSNEGYKKTIKLKKHLSPKRLKKFHTTKPTIVRSASYSNKESNWFWLRYGYLSSFKRGLFWGMIVTLTAIISAGFGAALTKIDVVEKTIKQSVLPHETPQKSANSNVLDMPLNVLLIEVKPDIQSLVKLEPGAKSKSQKILVLEFDPQIGLAKVVNIPLDSQVKVPGAGWGTIADAHRRGGVALTTKMVEQLMNNVEIDRHLQATSQTYQQLTASGKLNLKGCDSRIQDCTSMSKQIEIQQKGFEAIRQRLNISAYLNNFQQNINKIRPNLNTNITTQEFIAIANFVKTLEQDNVSINFLPSYTPGEMLTTEQEKISASQQLQNTQLSQTNNTFTPTSAEPIINFAEDDPLLKSLPIVVENNTNNLELGIKIVDYLQSQNFQDVYLVGHIPLELEQTKIIASHDQLKLASYLQDTLGIGNLKQKENSTNKSVILRLGNDANYLTQDNLLKN